MAKLLFTRRPVIGSTLIRTVTWSGWSHVQGFVNDTDLIGAGWPDGVVRESLGQRLSLASRAAVMTIPVADEDAFAAYLRSQIGKPYDTLGMLGIGLHRDWRSDDAWWCSELQAAALQKAGCQIFRDGAIRRVTQQDIWVQNFPTVEIK